MGGFSTVHWLIFGIVGMLLFRKRLPNVARSVLQSLDEFKREMRDLEIELRSLKNRQRGPVMREHMKKFLWTWRFWAVLGLVGCVSGLYFQRVAANGSGLWCLGLIFLGAAYLEQKD
jgi:TatA/E family protein of Tat protein translocase